MGSNTVQLVNQLRKIYAGYSHFLLWAFLVHTLFIGSGVVSAQTATPEPPPDGVDLNLDVEQLPPTPVPPVQFPGVPPLPTPFDTSVYTSTVDIDFDFGIEELGFLVSIMRTPIQWAFNHPQLRLFLYGGFILLSVRVIMGFVGGSGSDPLPPRDRGEKL